MAQQELEVTMTLKTGLEQQGQTILNYFLTSHILLFLTVFGFFSFFVSYLSSFSSFFFFLHNVQLYTVLRHSLLIVLSFSFAGRAVFISEFSFPLLLSFTYCAFI